MASTRGLRTAASRLLWNRSFGTAAGRQGDAVLIDGNKGFVAACQGMKVTGQDGAKQFDDSFKMACLSTGFPHLQLQKDSEADVPADRFIRESLRENMKPVALYHQLGFKSLLSGGTQLPASKVVSSAWDSADRISVPLGLGKQRRLLALPGAPRHSLMIRSPSISSVDQRRTTFSDSVLVGPEYTWSGYGNLLQLLFVALLISSAMRMTAYLAPKRISLDKASAYECGFEAFGEARSTSDQSFSLVALLFLLMDIEIAAVLPGVFALNSWDVYWPLTGFLAILVVGAAYEWQCGALDWT